MGSALHFYPEGVTGSGRHEQGPAHGVYPPHIRIVIELRGKLDAAHPADRTVKDGLAAGVRDDDLAPIAAPALMDLASWVTVTLAGMAG